MKSFHSNILPRTTSLFRPFASAAFFRLALEAHDPLRGIDRYARRVRYTRFSLQRRLRIDRVRWDDLNRYHRLTLCRV